MKNLLKIVNQLFNRSKSELQTYPFIREVSSPISDNMLTPLDSRCDVVQFNRDLTDNDYKKLSKFLMRYPRITLRAYGGYGHTLKNVNFIKYFPNHKAFAVDVPFIDNLDGLSWLSSDLEYLGIGNTVHKNFSLNFLTLYPHLKNLYINGHHKDIEAVSCLVELEHLILRSISLPSATLLEPLTNLQYLAIKLGGIKDISALTHLPLLKYLELWRIRGLTDIESISNITSLEYIFLQSLKHINHIPDLSRLNNLDRFHLESMKNIHDLTPITSAPALKELLVLDMPQLELSNFEIFKKYPSLKSILMSLGNINKNAQIQNMLELSPAQVVKPPFY